VTTLNRLAIHIDSTAGLLAGVTPETVANAERRYPGVLDGCTVSYGPLSDASAAVDVLFTSSIAVPPATTRWMQVGDVIAGDPTNGPCGMLLTDGRGARLRKLEEILLLALLMLNNHVPALIERQRARTWSQLFATGIAGKTLLVLGVGEVGGALARRAHAFGLTVYGTRRSGCPHPDVVSMHAGAPAHNLLSLADFVAVTLPPGARGQFGRAELAALAPTTTVVSVAAPGVVDEVALAEALHAGRLGGAVLITHAVASSPVRDAPNAVVLPATIADDPDELPHTLLDLFLDNVGRFRRGGVLRNVVKAAT
jgi:phosphoglycerate dehydrogenase-like enzyme